MEQRCVCFIWDKVFWCELFQDVNLFSKKSNYIDVTNFNVPICHETPDDVLLIVNVINWHTVMHSRDVVGMDLPIVCMLCCIHINVVLSSSVTFALLCFVAWSLLLLHRMSYF